MSEGTVWEPIELDVPTVSCGGRTIYLSSVPAQVNKKTGTRRIRTEDLIKEEQKYVAKEHGINPHQIYVLLLLFAPGKFIKQGYVDTKYRFNKMLFYIWKGMEQEVLGDAFVFDDFNSCRAGPIPRSLKDDLIELSDKGLIELKAKKDNKIVERGKTILEKRQPDISIRSELTDKGMALAKSIWYDTPDDVREIIKRTKENLFLVDSTQLKEKVHRDFPEFKKTYVELDTE